MSKVIQGYQPEHGDLDTNNPPEDFTAIQQARDECFHVFAVSPLGWVCYRILDGLLWLAERFK